MTPEAAWAVLPVMAMFSIAAGFLALVLTFFGLMFAGAPNLGAVFSLLSVITALAGIVSGGLGISRAKYDGRSTGTAIGGLVLSVLVFFPALLFGLTCGLCNAAISAESQNPSSRPFWHDGGIGRDQDSGVTRVDGGKPGQSAPTPSGAGANPAADPNAVDPNAPADPRLDSPPPAFPPPAFPPPPMP